MQNRGYGDTDFITGLRAIAILLVFLIHSGGGGLRELGPWGNFITECGSLGVQVFFVISGFTIFSQFFLEKYTFKKFILVRLSRISLPYYPLIFALFIFNSLDGEQFNFWSNQINHGQIDLLNLFAHIIYISTYNIQWQNTIIGVEWTLGIEVYFYILFGILIANRVIGKSIKSLVITGLASAAITALTTYIYRLRIIDPYFLSWLPFRYSLIFFLGGLSYFAREWLHKTLINQPSLSRQISDFSLSAIALTFSAFAALSHFVRTPGFIVEYFFIFATFFTIITNSKHGKLSSILSSKLLIFLGSISFSFYLIHYIVIQAIPNQFANRMIEFSFKLAATIALSYYWHKLFEKKLYAKVKTAIKRLD